VDEDTSSKANLSNFHVHSTKSAIGCLESRQTSLDTTISSSSISQGYNVNSKESVIAELVETNALLTKTAHVKIVCRSVKRKARNIEEYSKFIIL
jgi:hypothetical protein